MEWFFSILIFLASCVALYISGELIVRNLMRLSRFLGLKEFVVAFFVMAFAASLPNLFVGITSALGGIPELSLGDVFGNNFTALTLAVAAAVLFTPLKEINIESRTIKISSVFTIIAAILPLLLIMDGVLSRLDGVILIIAFLFYTSWLFSKKENFSKTYDNEGERPHAGNMIRETSKSLFKAALGIGLLFVAAQGIVASASFFAEGLGLPIVFIGILLLGFGNALPEVYFSIASARRGETFMILGNLLGSVIVPATLVLGVVSIIHPIILSDSFSLVISRIFLIAAALFFLLFARTHHKITKKEAWFLFILYVAFIATLILSR